MLGPLTLLLAVLPAGGAPASFDGCPRCEYTGVVACGKHPSELLEYELGVLFCREAAACETCGGAMRVDCPGCSGGPGQRAAEERRRAVQAWLADTKVEESLGRIVPRVETERFHLIVDTGTLKDGSKKVDQHTLVHWIADDLERVASSIAEHFDVQPGDYDSKMRMWIWRESEDHAKVMREFLHSTSTGDFKMLGRAPAFSVWTEPPFDTVPGVRAVFAHNAAHMLVSNVIRPLWVGDTGGGWLDVGSAHWCEYSLFDRSVNYCIEEATSLQKYHDGVWRAPVRRFLAKEEAPFLPEITTKNTGAMEVYEHALCWSFYEYLVSEHPDALRPILADLKERKETRTVFQERLGMSVLEAENAWRAWVDERYPNRGDEPREPKKR